MLGLEYNLVSIYLQSRFSDTYICILIFRYVEMKCWLLLAFLKKERKCLFVVNIETLNTG